MTIPVQSQQLSIMLGELKNSHDLWRAAHNRRAEFRQAMRDASDEALVDAHEELRALIQTAERNRSRKQLPVWSGLGTSVGMELARRRVVLRAVSRLVVGGGLPRKVFLSLQLKLTCPFYSCHQRSKETVRRSQARGGSVGAGSMVCPMRGHEFVFAPSLLALVLCIVFREALYLSLSLPAGVELRHNSFGWMFL